LRRATNLCPFASQYFNFPDHSSEIDYFDAPDVEDLVRGWHLDFAQLRKNRDAIINVQGIEPNPCTALELDLFLSKDLIDDLGEKHPGLPRAVDTKQPCHYDLKKLRVGTQ
jgi:hypothetical protein